MPPEVQAAHRDRQQTSDARAGCVHPRAGVPGMNDGNALSRAQRCHVGVCTCHLRCAGHCV